MIIPNSIQSLETRRGVTLVELLVAMVIGIFLVGGVVSVMIDGKRNFLLEEELAFIQENTRFALNHITRDVRMAGFYGCGSSATITNSLKGAADNWLYQTDAIKGFESSEKTSSDFPSQLVDGLADDTDILIVHRARADESMLVKSASGDSITVASPPFFKANEILALASASCRNVGIFQVSADPQGNIIKHEANTGSPGNCAISLAGYDDCSSNPDVAVSDNKYGSGSTLQRFSTTAYHIKESAITGLPTLYVYTLDSSGSGQSQELVSGVENMQVFYGVDTDSTVDGVVDRFLKADEITETGTLQWNRVFAVRITLIFRSLKPAFSSDTQVDLGGGFTFNDRYLRQIATQTIRIRNRDLEISNES